MASRFKKDGVSYMKHNCLYVTSFKVKFSPILSRTIKTNNTNMVWPPSQVTLLHFPSLLSFYSKKSSRQVLKQMMTRLKSHAASTVPATEIMVSFFHFNINAFLVLDSTHIYPLALLISGF